MSNPIALITGGSRGLGRAAALALADHGMDLIITYRAEQALADELVAELVARGPSAVALPLDIGDTASLPAFAETVRHTLTERWGRPTFDHLVNNAGHGLYAPFAATQEADFDRLLSVHLKGPFFLTQALLPLLADGGSILNLSSGLTRFAPGLRRRRTGRGRHASSPPRRHPRQYPGDGGLRRRRVRTPALNAIMAQTALVRSSPATSAPVIAMLLLPLLADARRHPRPRRRPWSWCTRFAPTMTSPSTLRSASYRDLAELARRARCHARSRRPRGAPRSLQLDGASRGIRVNPAGAGRHRDRLRRRRGAGQPRAERDDRVADRARTCGASPATSAPLIATLLYAARAAGSTRRTWSSASLISGAATPIGPCRPTVRLEGDRWLARLDRANTLPGQLVIDRRTGAMQAEETARRR